MKNSEKSIEADDVAVTLVTQVADSIIDGVMSGKFAPGQRLISADLSELYGVSRAPVREALHLLAGEGVVEIIANRGARLRKLSIQESMDFLELTEAVLSLGIRRAVPSAHSPDFQRTMTAAFETIVEAHGRRHARDFVDALYKYHVDLNGLSGNQYLHNFYKKPYVRFYTTVLSEVAPGNNWDRFMDNYTEIHKTVIAGDTETAMVTFSAHIRWVVREMAAQLTPAKSTQKK